jgi:hypothetical protein
LKFSEILKKLLATWEPLLIYGDGKSAEKMSGAERCGEVECFAEGAPHIYLAPISALGPLEVGNHFFSTGI